MADKPFVKPEGYGLGRKRGKFGKYKSKRGIRIRGKGTLAPWMVTMNAMFRHLRIYDLDDLTTYEWDYFINRVKNPKSPMYRTMPPHIRENFIEIYNQKKKECEMLGIEWTQVEYGRDGVKLNQNPGGTNEDDSKEDDPNSGKEEDDDQGEDRTGETDSETEEQDRKS